MHLLYSPSLSVSSIAMGAAAMGATFAVPYSHYVKTNGRLSPAAVLKSYFGAVPDHLK